MMRPVWVIDDDRSIRWVFEKALAREGIPFKTFAQATEAMEALDATGAPQVLVSDIRMPGTSGLELLQTLKQRFPDLPVIVMTMTGRSGKRCFRVCSSSKPDVPGMRMSETSTCE